MEQTDFVSGLRGETERGIKSYQIYPCLNKRYYENDVNWKPYSVLVFGGVFLIVVIWALFFRQRYMKMYNSSSNDDDDGNLEADSGDNHRIRRTRQRVSLIRTISCSNNQNGTGNYNTDIPLSNLQMGMMRV